MYQAVMKHLVYISDEKVRQEQEDRLVGLIAQNLQQAIQILIAAYGLGQMRDERDCGCDEEALMALEREIAAKEKKEGNEKIQRQRAAKNAFKNREVDENSRYYQEYVKKGEREWNLIVFKYRTNDYFNAAEGGIWTPWGSFSHSSVTNSFTGVTKGSNRLSISVPVGPVKVSGKWEVDYVRAADGTIHPQDLDRRSSIEVSGGYGPLSATAGISFTPRGTSVYSNIELSGSEYIDVFKEDALGEVISPWVEIETPSKKVWNGEYTFE
jgi:hypothetical protein